MLKDRLHLHNLDGRWCVVMSGCGPDGALPQRVRATLNDARVPWSDDSDDLSLELVNPSATQVLNARQDLGAIKGVEFHFNGKRYT